jgi:hypothetical protein
MVHIGRLILCLGRLIDIWVDGFMKGRGKLMIGFFLTGMGKS